MCKHEIISDAINIFGFAMYGMLVDSKNTIINIADKNGLYFYTNKCYERYNKINSLNGEKW